jgi:D-methionine transport system ATP-binding protein
LSSKVKPALASLLCVENLAYVLPYQSILQPLTFAVAAGEMILVTGAKGVGKTLLLRLLNRLTEPSGGTVYLAGQDYRLMALPQLRRQVALVSAEPNLLGMTVQAALLYPLQLQKLSARDAAQRLVQLLGQIPIPESWLPLLEPQLSIDQRQIVSLARSLVLQPQVLLWDEPAQYLDAIWWQRVQSIAREQGMAVIMTGKPADLGVSRVLYLRAGQLAEEQSAVNWAELGAEIDRTEQAAAADWQD